jgi:hypothetical protein
MANFMGDYNDSVDLNASGATVDLTLTEMWGVMVTPANGATGVATDSSIMAMFTDAMNTSTVNETTFRLMKGVGKEDVTGLNFSMWTNGNKTLEITHTEPFDDAETYYIEITTDAMKADDTAALHRSWNTMFTIKVGLGSVEGYVTDEDTGDPLAGVFVSIGDINDTTDASGYYKLDGLTAGPKTISGTLANYDAGSVDVTAVAGTTIMNVNFTI